MTERNYKAVTRQELIDSAHTRYYRHYQHSPYYDRKVHNLLKKAKTAQDVISALNSMWITDRCDACGAWVDTYILVDPGGFDPCTVVCADCITSMAQDLAEAQK